MNNADKTTMDPESRKIRSRQLLLFSSLAAAVLFAFAAWFSAGDGGAPPPRGGVRAELAGAGSAEAVWVRRSESRIGQVEARLRDLETKNRRSEEENARLRARLAKGAADGRMVIDRQAAAIDALRQKLDARTVAPVPAKKPGPGAGGNGAPPGGKPASVINSAMIIEGVGSVGLGLSMKQLPQAIATGNIHAGTMTGKLNGVTPATTPRGWRSVQLSIPADA